jgi:glycosyltransferase involved in cell wall biosynthesis
MLENIIKSHPANIKLIFDPTAIEIKRSIDACTFLCLPSIHESFGLVFAESLARGKPVIGADTPQTSEVIKLLRGGITFKSDDLPDLIDKIGYLLNNPAISRNLGLNGYQFVKNHLTWDKIGHNLWSNISSSSSS